MRKTRWVAWFDLTDAQKLQARHDFVDVRREPLLFEYEIDANGAVVNVSLIGFD